MILVIVDSGNALLALWCQAIIWTNIDLLPVSPQEQRPLKFESKYNDSHSTMYN